jgi:biopolymer transport protein ExbD
MSEVSQEGGGGKKKGGKIRSKKTSTRIDMTPMVDLAFLLLTFFVMTTTLNKPQTMEIAMPEDDKEEKAPQVNEKHVLTIIMGENDKIYWYMGITDPEVKITNFSPNGIRKLLLEKKRDIPKLVVLIKSMDESKYKNMVDILDEMNITSTQRYAIVDVTSTDKELVKDATL